MAVYGYMRVSTQDNKQSFDRQEAQLADCDYIYRDKISGSKKSRPELDQLLNDLQEGDTVWILSIDRLSRSTKDLLEIVEAIKNKGASLKSIQDTWLDTSSENPMSDFLLTVMGALSEMERKQINKRVREGVEVAQQKGVKFGRPTANKNKVNYSIELYNSGGHTVREITDITGVSKATLYRKLKKV